MFAGFITELAHKPIKTIKQTTHINVIFAKTHGFSMVLYVVTVICQNIVDV